MSIELKQVVEQSLDLSTPTLREMVTRHAAVIDSRATLEDMPEALAFQINMARALLREFTAIHQAEAQQPDNAACKSVQKRVAAQQPATGGPVVSRNPFASRCYTMSESHLSGHRLIVGFEKLGDAQDAHEWVAQQGRGDFTHPAPSVPADVVRDAERYRFILAAADDMTTSRYKSLCELLGVAITEDFDLGAAIDAAMLAAKERP